MAFMAISALGGSVTTRAQFAPEGEKVGQAYCIYLPIGEFYPNRIAACSYFGRKADGAPAHRWADSLCR